MSGPVLYAAVSGDAFGTALAVHEAGPAGARQPRLLDRVREAIRTRHYSRRTEKTYVAWIRRYILFHGKRHPTEMGAAEITRFLTSLAVDGKVAAATQNQALSALLFLYRDVLQQKIPWLDGVVRAKRPQRLPVVLSCDEVRAVLERLDGVPRLMAFLLYGAGLRLLECARLRVKDVDFTFNQITVRGGKGNKDCVTMLPATAKADLARHLEVVRAQHRLDLARGAGWVELPGALARKYPASSPRDCPPARLQRCRPPRRHLQACNLPHVAPLLCDSLARGRPRHPHDPGAAGPPRRQHDDDLHARAQPRAERGPEPGRSDLHPMTSPKADRRPDQRGAEIGCRGLLHNIAADHAASSAKFGKANALRPPAGSRVPGLGCSERLCLPCYTVPPISRWTAVAEKDAKRD